MCTQRDTTESYQEHKERSAENAESSPMPCFEGWQDKQQQLAVKQSGSDGMTAGKTVSRPIYKRAVNKRSLPMNLNLEPFVQQHATGNGND